MKPTTPSCHLPFSCSPYGFPFCCPRHRRPLTEPPLFLGHTFSLKKCCFLLFLCCSYEILAKDRLTSEPKDAKLCREVHTVRQVRTGE